MTTKCNKKRIRPSDYIRAYVICMIICAICLCITVPVLMGAARYWGMQRTIDDIRYEASKYGWTDERTAESKVYEDQREEMAKQDPVFGWCYNSSKDTFKAIIRNIIIIGIIPFVFLFGLAVIAFTSYCIGRDAKYIVKTAFRKANMARGEKMHAKVYEQFGLQAPSKMVPCSR